MGSPSTTPSDVSAAASDVGAAAGDPHAGWRAVPVVMVGTFMAIMDVFIVLVAAPAIQADLHASAAEVQFVLAGYQLAYAVTLITGGRLGDMYGRKAVLLIGMAVFVVASAGCGVAPNAASLIGIRLVQGVGAALMFPQVFSIIQVLLPESQRHRAFGVLGAVIGLSTIVGQVVGGLLIHADLFGSSWRPVFLINVPIGLVTIALVARLVPESRAARAHRLDMPGVLVLTVALFLLVVPLVEGGQYGWPAWSWGSLGACVLAFGVFVLVERGVAARGRTPLVALPLLVQRPFVVGMSLVMVAYAALNSFFLVLSLTLQDGLGLSALGAGLVYAPQAALFLGASLLAGRLAPILGRRLLVLGGVITVLGFAATIAVAVASGPRLTAGILVPTLLIQGVGEGLMLTPLINAVLSRTGREHVGLASGVLSTAQQVGGALGVAVVGMIFFATLRGTAGVGNYAHAIGVATIFNLAMTALATVLVLALPKAE